MIDVVIHGGNIFERTFLLPPGVPKDRAELLKRAFARTMEDPEFLADANKAKLGVAPVSGDELERRVNGFFKLPEDLKKKLKASSVRLIARISPDRSTVQDRLIQHEKNRRISTMPHLNVSDAEIYYEVHGEGSPFLFCSVTGLDHQAWKFHQVREFSRDHKVIVFDYRGTGKSSKTVQKYSIKMFTDDAAALLDHLELEQAIVCGHSMGGVVAQLLALECHPNKVRKLILASSGSSHPRSEGHSSRHVPRHGSHGLRGLYSSAHH